MNPNKKLGELLGRRKLIRKQDMAKLAKVLNYRVLGGALIGYGLGLIGSASLVQTLGQFWAGITIIAITIVSIVLLDWLKKHVEELADDMTDQ